MENTSPGLLCLFIIVALGLLYWRLIGVKSWRKRRINSHVDEWGKDICRMLIDRRIAIDMSKDMVKLSLGKPTKIDDVEVTVSSRKERWIYGKRGNAGYIWFRNGKVIKMKQ